MPVVEIQTDGAVDVEGDDRFSFRLMARDILKIQGGICPSWINSDICRTIKEILQGLKGKIVVFKIIGLSVSRVEKVQCDAVEAYCDRTVKFVCVQNGKKKHLMDTLSVC